MPPAPGYIQLGVSVEPLAELSAKEGSRLGEAWLCVCEGVGGWGGDLEGLTAALRAADRHSTKCQVEQGGSVAAECNKNICSQGLISANK